MTLTHFKIVVIITVLAFGLLGCGAAPVYNKHGASTSQKEKDVAECRLQALTATGSAPGGSIAYTYAASQTIANDLATGMRQAEINDLCLRSRGYYIVPQ